MIPKFPDFKIIEVDDRKAVESYTHRHLPYSDFNFTSLWAWDTSNERMISDLNGNLAVRFTDYKTNELFFSFLGANKPEQTASELIQFAKATNVSPVLRLIPEESAVGIKSAFNAEEDRNNYDYVYSTSELAVLKGLKFKGMRHLSKRFLREYPDARFEISNLNDTDTQKHIIAVLRMWENEKKCDRKGYELEHEEAALNRLFQTASDHQLMVSSIFCGDDMICFSIDEILPNQYAIAHFLKAGNSFTGASDFINVKVAHHLESNDIAMWNWEQDLGLESLHRQKMSYRPVGFLKKYTLQERT
jgi:hypothetical protein